MKIGKVKVTTILTIVSIALALGTIAWLVYANVINPNNSDLNCTVCVGEGCTVELCNKTGNDYSKLIESCLQVVTCFIASLSLIYTLEAKNENIQLKIETRKNELDLEWYNSIIVKRHMDSVCGFFDFAYSLVTDFKNVNEKRQLEDWKHSQYTIEIKDKVVLPFTEQYIEVQQKLVSDAYIIDDKLGCNIKDEFSSFQDAFTDYIQNSQPNYELMKSMVLDYRKKLVKTLRDYNFDIVK